MSAYSNQKDIDYFYNVVADVADSLSEVSPNTASSFTGYAKERTKTPFEILRKMNMKLIQAQKRRVTLP